MNAFYLLILSFFVSILLGFTIVPQLGGYDILSISLTIYSICLALLCFILPKWEIWRDSLLEKDEEYKKYLLDTFKALETIKDQFSEVPDVVDNYVVKIKEILKTYCPYSKMAEEPILGYKHLISICMILLVLHFVLNVLLIPSDIFVTFIKTTLPPMVDEELLRQLAKRISSTISISTISVQLVLLYKIAKDSLQSSLCLKSKENIENTFQSNSSQSSQN